MEYATIRWSLQYGDVLLFKGTDILSQLICKFTEGNYSHVGICLGHVGLGFGWKGDVYDRVLMVESTATINIPDAKTRKIRKGVQLHWLSTRLDMFDGSVYLAPLERTFSDEQIKKTRDLLKKHHDSGTPYDYIQALGCTLEHFEKFFGFKIRSATPEFGRLFCSEFAGRFFQIAGLLDKHVNPSLMTPQDIAGLQFLRNPIEIKP